MLGCKEESLPSLYLSLPFGSHFKSIQACDRVEEIFKKKKKKNLLYGEDCLFIIKRGIDLNKEHFF